MASLPAPNRQRQSQASPPSSEEAQQSSQRNASPSTKSVDSQTLFLNDPSTTSDQADNRQDAGDASSSEPKKCWICFSDETEDTPQNRSTWKTPCPCALTAHESCLLDWIADMEAPQSGRSASQQKEIKCPQCKSEIKLSRPRSLAVEFMGALEKLTGQMLLPTVIGGTMYAVGIVSSHHGAHSIRMIFGRDAAEQILAPTPHQSILELHLLRYFPVLAKPFFRDWRGIRVEAGLPLIPATLILSRTRLADTILPLLPLAFFATDPQHVSEVTHPFWPPSAALTFIVLPYIRGLYGEYMERVWCERERSWSREVHPRLGGEERNANEENGNEGDEGDEGDMVQLQIDIEEEIGDDGQDEAAPPPIAGREEQAPPLQQPPVDAEQQGQERQQAQEQPQEGGNEQDQGQGQGQQQQQAGQQQGHPQRQRIDINFLAYATRIAETSIGALLFPTVSAVMGEAMRYALPTAWTVPRSSWGRPVPTGIFQTQWGRSIIGGCLFVALKDALRLYTKHQMALSYRNRRVVDYDRRTKAFVE